MSVKWNQIGGLPRPTRNQMLLFSGAQLFSHPFFFKDLEQHGSSDPSAPCVTLGLSFFICKIQGLDKVASGVSSS